MKYLLLLAMGVIAILLFLLGKRGETPLPPSSPTPVQAAAQVPTPPSPSPASETSKSSSNYSADAILQLVADADESTHSARTKQQCDKIILPTVQFDSMDIQQALDTLIRLAREHSSEPLPKIVFPSGPLPNAQLSLQLSNVPLSDALRYVTELGNLTLQFEENEVILTTKK